MLISCSASLLLTGGLQVGRLCLLSCYTALLLGPAMQCTPLKHL